MSYSKEGPPLDTVESVNSLENKFVAVQDLTGVLTRVGVPTPLQERIMKEAAAVSSTKIMEVIDDLGEFLDNLPEYERDELEREAVKALKDELRINERAINELRAQARAEVRDEVREEVEGETRIEVEEEAEKKFGPLFDRYLAEVVRFWGFRLGELSSQERMQIEHIRRGLDIPGEFDPDADGKHFR